LNILGHDGDALGMNGAQVGIFEQANQVGFSRFLKRKDSRALETKIRLKILCNLSNKALKGKLANQQVGRLLVTANLAKSDSAWTVAMRLFDTSRSWSTLASSLGGELFAWSLASSGLASYF
jgi:hypothetical protein